MRSSLGAAGKLRSVKLSGIRASDVKLSKLLNTCVYFKIFFFLLLKRDWLIDRFTNVANTRIVHSHDITDRCEFITRICMCAPIDRQTDVICNRRDSGCIVLNWIDFRDREVDGRAKCDRRGSKGSRQRLIWERRFHTQVRESNAYISLRNGGARNDIIH